MPNLELLIYAIADPLSELEQKTDSLCLPNLELLSFALACVAQPIADPFSGLANAVDSLCLLICVSLRGVANRTQTISTDSMGDIGTYNGLGFSGGKGFRVTTRVLSPSAASPGWACLY